MICIDIPDIAPLRLEHLVPDFNGTPACNPACGFASRLARRSCAFRADQN
jgi:hypothetical protein